MKGGIAMPNETYKQARLRIMRALGGLGWKLSDLSLKVLHATHPHGRVRLWFRPQAVHAEQIGDPRYGKFCVGNAHSLFADIRDMGEAQLLELVFGRYVP